MRRLRDLPIGHKLSVIVLVTTTVALAPDLPAAHFALASAQLADTAPLQAFGSASDGVSAILYSRSRYGGWDMGVNRKRLRRWLARLEASA